MSSNKFRFEFQGMESLRRRIQALPEEFVTASDPLVIAHANAAAAEVATVYAAHVHTGRLQAGLAVQVRNTRKGVAATVVSRAPHVHLFEDGTKVRATQSGANRGAMPAFHVFIPAMQRAREALKRDVRALIESYGLEVKGAA